MVSQASVTINRKLYPAWSELWLSQLFHSHWGHITQLFSSVQKNPLKWLTFSLLLEDSMAGEG